MQFMESVINSVKMKLLTKTNIYYVAFALFTNISIAVTFYYIAENLIYEEVETRLQSEKRDFESFIRNQGVWYKSCYFVENKIEFQPISTLDKGEYYKDTLLYNRYNDEFIPFRQLTFFIELEGTPYKISIRKSLIESDKLIKYITYTMLLLLILGFSFMYIIQHRLSKSIWKPFYTTLSTIKSFKLGADRKVNFIKSGIYEFEELNKVLTDMTSKLQKDYKNLKEFTDNASHEMQTPVAIISGRIEELIQTKNLTSHQSYLINEIHNTCSRLSKISKALLLLSKIENKQFRETKKINFGELIKNKIEEFEELFIHRKIHLKMEFVEEFVCNLNPALADILLNNLLSNAIKHNISGGTIIISLSSSNLEIANTGEPLIINPKDLFQRFRKGRYSQDSTGLGLAIVKQICNNYGLDVVYSYKNNLHYISITRK